MTKLTYMAIGMALLASPALADIGVSVVPDYYVAGLGDTQATVEIWADIPIAEAIIGFGFDVASGDPAVAYNSFACNTTLFTPVPSSDGDGIQGLSFIPRWGNILLGTMTFDLLGLGTSQITFSDDNPQDLTEGFALEQIGAFATVNYGSGTIVVPEPASLGLLALGSLLAARRRR